MRRRIVVGLEWLCERTHWITLRCPWLWFFRNCPFAELSQWLDERWGTGEWKVLPVKPSRVFGSTNSNNVGNVTWIER